MKRVCEREPDPVIPVAARLSSPVIVPQPSSPPPARSALILAFAAIYVIWGSTYLGIRVAIETMPPFLMAGFRFMLAGGILLAVLRWRGLPFPTARQWKANAVIGLFLLLGGNGLVVWAEQYVPSGITALIIGIQPLFFVLTEWAWPGGSRPTLVTTLSLLVGFAGVAWLAAPWETSAQGGLHLPGVTAILAACVFWAIGSIYSRHARHGADPLLAAAAQMLSGGVALTLLGLVTGEPAVVDVAAISTRSWIAFVYLVLCGSLIGFSTFVWLMKHSTPARVSTYAYVNPVVAVALGWLILDEPVNSRTIVASIVIVAAVMIVTMEKNRAQAKPRP
jgi:drug/metabolite transporter (DMT)-like permease